MGQEAEKPQPERDKTDESLRVERKNSDQALAERRGDVEVAADLLLKRARQQADAVLDVARDRADQKLGTPEVSGREAVDRERALEDEAVLAERAAADEILRRERREQAASLAALLPLEREKTDRYLWTERARSDDELAHRDDFMGIVSHDLRNLLSGIAMNAGLVAKQAASSEEGQRTVFGMKRIERYVARMNRLIGDLVDVVSLDAGKLKTQTGPSDAATLLVEAVEAFAGNAAEKGISLDAAPIEGALTGQFDRDRMLQVLSNLIANALKFTARGGSIVVHGARVGDAIHLSVQDNGMGIPEPMLESVFERFWQVGKHDRRGLGLGLYISRCIVEAHGGKIWVESAVGAGSTFHVTIPCEP